MSEFVQKRAERLEDAAATFRYQNSLNTPPILELIFAIIVLCCAKSSLVAYACLSYQREAYVQPS